MIAHIVGSLIVGVIFGLGLVISGMINPAKVLNFLDVAGPWDPSLIFVMAGAIAVTFIGYRLVLRRPSPVLADEFNLPPTSGIDHRLIVGPAIFGIGWGLAGLCPGPAISALALGASKVAVFVVFMFAGLTAARAITSKY